MGRTVKFRAGVLRGAGHGSEARRGAGHESGVDPTADRGKGADHESGVNQGKRVDHGADRERGAIQGNRGSRRDRERDPRAGHVGHAGQGGHGDLRARPAAAEGRGGGHGGGHVRQIRAVVIVATETGGIVRAVPRGRLQVNALLQSGAPPRMWMLASRRSGPRKLASGFQGPLMRMMRCIKVFGVRVAAWTPCEETASSAQCARTTICANGATTRRQQCTRTTDFTCRRPSVQHRNQRLMCPAWLCGLCLRLGPWLYLL